MLKKSPTDDQTPQQQAAQPVLEQSAVPPLEPASPLERIYEAEALLEQFDRQAQSDHPSESTSSNSPDSDSANADDRRSLPRRDGQCSATVCRLRTNGPIQQQQVDWLLHAAHANGQVEELSMTSIALLLPESFESGDRVFLRLCNRRLDTNIDTTATVLRCSEVEDGEWRTVCRLECKLTIEQTHLFGLQFSASEIV